MYAMQYTKQESATPVLITIAVHVAIVFGLAKGLGAIPSLSAEKQPFKVIDIPTQIEPPPPVEVLAQPNSPVSQLYVPAINAPSIPVEVGPVVIATLEPIIDVGTGTDSIIIEETTSSARVLQSAEPPYPSISRLREEEGTVLVKIMITPYGTAGNVQIEKSSGYSRLDEAAIKAVRGWKFAPAKRGTQAIATWVTVPVKFVLNSGR